MIARERLPRVLAGTAVLLLMVAFALRLIPPYVENWKLQRYVNELVDDPSIVNRSAETIKSDVENRAASLGLPVHDGDVHITKSADSLRIDVLYVVRIDMAGYTVGLHFRPAAGGS